MTNLKELDMSMIKVVAVSLSLSALSAMAIEMNVENRITTTSIVTTLY
jgi:hypothetical protein